MALQLGDVEKRLRSLIEVHLTKYLPGPTYQDRIAQRLSEVLQTSLSTQKKNAGEKGPSDFALAIHPSTLNQWNKEPLLIDGITKIFRLMASELGLQSETPLKLSIITDPTVEIDDLQIRALKNVSVAETQEKDNDASDSALPSKPAFLIVGGTKVFSIQTTVTNIGRRLDNHLVVNDPRVSRYHAQIRCARGRFLIFDLNSTGGTYVNGQRTSQSVLYPGDVISLAGLPIIFGQDNPPIAPGSTGTAPLTPTTSERHTAVLRDIGKKGQ
jgi:pSer/pThr/pTyr-binding forkhead associated (FHA) protein